MSGMKTPAKVIKSKVDKENVPMKVKIYNVRYVKYEFSPLLQVSNVK